MSVPPSLQPGASPSSIPDTQPASSSPLAPTSASATAESQRPPPPHHESHPSAPEDIRAKAQSPPIDPNKLNNSPAPLPIPASDPTSGDRSQTEGQSAALTSPPLRSPENAMESSSSGYLDAGMPVEPASHPTVAETGPLTASVSRDGPGPKSGQLERKERKQGEGIIKLGSFGGEGLKAKPPVDLHKGDDNAIE